MVCTDDWVVTLRQLAVPDPERVEAHEEESVVNISAAAKTIDIAVDEQQELPTSLVVDPTHSLKVGHDQDDYPSR